jgi:hypothetical protein
MTIVLMCPQHDNSSLIRRRHFQQTTLVGAEPDLPSALNKTTTLLMQLCPTFLADISLHQMPSDEGLSLCIIVRIKPSSQI